MMRAITRAMNRAGIPVAYSEGFNPHPKLSMGPALPLGYESRCEFTDITLTQPLTHRDLHERLAATMPSGLGLLGVGWVLGSSPRLSDAFSARYMIELWEETVDNAEALIHDFLTRDVVPVERVRQDKSTIVDVKQCVTNVEVAVVGGVLCLQSDISLGVRGTCNASEVAQAILKLTPDRAKCLRIVRTDIRFQKRISKR